MKKYLQRFKNTGTIISLIGLIGILLTQLGYTIDLNWLNAITNTICSIFVVLGICNNPNTTGIDLPVSNE